MNICSNRFDFELRFDEYMAGVLSIEKPEILSLIIEDLWNQCNGLEGDLLLSDSEGTLPFSKCSVFISNPFAIEINSGKVLKELYKELDYKVQEDHFEEFVEINSKIVLFLDNLEKNCLYPLSFNTELEPSSLFKLYSLKMDWDVCSLLEKLENYLVIMNQVCKIFSFFFLNLKQFLDQNSLMEFYRFANYLHVHIFIIEGQHTQHITGEKGYILDADLCLIEL